MIFCVSYGFSQEFNKPFKFLVPSFEEACQLFEILNYFSDIESGIIRDEETIKYFLENSFKFDGLLGMFGQSYFRETENEMVRNFVIEYFEESDNDMKEIIENKFDSTKEIVEMTEMNTYRYNLNNELYDENIKYGNLMNLSLFNDQLSIYIPESDWIPFQFENKKTGEIDANEITFHTGGPTTAAFVKATRTDIDIIPQKNDIENLEKMMYVLDGENVISKNNSALTVLNISTSNEGSFIFSLTLYDDILMKKYEILYFSNISEANMNYRIYKKLNKQLMYTSFLNYIVR